MGMDIAAIAGLMQGAGNLASQGTNIFQTLAQEYRNWQARHDPNFYSLMQSELDQYNKMPSGGVYGDPTTGIGGALGYHEDGTPIQPGEANAQTIAGFLNSNPANTAMQTLNTASQMQRPGTPSFGDMFSGNPTGGTPAPQVMPAPAPMPVSGYSGASTPAPAKIPNPAPNTGTPLTATRPDDGLARALIDRWAESRKPPVATTGASPQANPSPLHRVNPTGRQGGYTGWGGGGGFGLPSYRVGTNYIPQTGPAYLHQGEAVVPKEMNPYAQVRNQMRNLPKQTYSQRIQAQQSGPEDQESPPPPAVTPKPLTMSASATGNQQVAQSQTGTQTGPQGPPPNTATGSSGTPVGTSPPPPTFTGVPATSMPAAPIQGQPDLNALRVALLGQQGANPESFTPQVQQQIMGGLTEMADRGLQGQMRSINEDAAARGLTNSGIPVQNAMQAYDARNAGLMDAQRQLGSQAALQNFQDRSGVANQLMQQQLGMGNASMEYQRMLNDNFNQDRAYNTGVARDQYQIGSSGRNDQMDYLANLMNSAGRGSDYQTNLINNLMNVLQFPYRNVDSGTQLQPFNTPVYNPQSSGGGDGGNNDWLTALLGGAGQLGSTYLMANAFN